MLEVLQLHTVHSEALLGRVDSELEQCIANGECSAEVACCDTLQGLCNSTLVLVATSRLGQGVVSPKPGEWGEGV